MIRRIDIRYHIREQCDRRHVSCTFKEAGCLSTFPIGDRQLHEQFYCTFVQNRDRIVEEGEVHNRIIACPQCSEQLTTRYRGVIGWGGMVGGGH